MGHQVMLPITKGALDLGPWEQVFYAEFDGRRRKRVVVKVMGELTGSTGSRISSSVPSSEVGGAILVDPSLPIVRRRHRRARGAGRRRARQAALRAAGGGVEPARRHARGRRDARGRRSRARCVEETGLVVDVGPLVEVFDRILLDDDGRGAAITSCSIDYLCRAAAGDSQAGSDVDDVVLGRSATRSPPYRLTEKAHGRDRDRRMKIGLRIDGPWTAMTTDDAAVARPRRGRS